MKGITYTPPGFKEPLIRDFEYEFTPGTSSHCVCREFWGHRFFTPPVPTRGSHTKTATLPFIPPPIAGERLGIYCRGRWCRQDPSGPPPPPCRRAAGHCRQERSRQDHSPEPHLGGGGAHRGGAGGRRHHTLRLLHPGNAVHKCSASGLGCTAFHRPSVESLSPPMTGKRRRCSPSPEETMKPL